MEQSRFVTTATTERDEYVHYQEAVRGFRGDCPRRCRCIRNCHSGSRCERLRDMRHQQRRWRLGGRRRWAGRLGVPQWEWQHQLLLLQHPGEALARECRLRRNAAELGSVDWLQLEQSAGRSDHHVRRRRLHQDL